MRDFAAFSISFRLATQVFCTGIILPANLFDVRKFQRVKSNLVFGVGEEIKSKKYPYLAVGKWLSFLFVHFARLPSPFPENLQWTDFRRSQHRYQPNQGKASRDTVFVSVLEFDLHANGIGTSLQRLKSSLMH